MVIISHGVSSTAEWSMSSQCGWSMLFWSQVKVNTCILIPV